MNFITIKFLIIFLVLYPLAIILKRYTRIYKIFMLIASIAFYSTYGIVPLILLLTSIGANYLFLTRISATDDPKRKKLLTIIIVALNISYLAFFKYANNLINIALKLNPSASFITEIFIPVGMSFYTFKAISHVVDLYKQKIELPQFLEYATFISFFPQVLSGPLTRAKDFYDDLNNPTRLVLSTGRVVYLIISGLIKKLLIASYLFTSATEVFIDPSNFSTIDLLIGAISYGAMLYADFSGYSDIAQALGGLFGIRIPDNFLYPYRSIGFDDFWSRWHISLSKWFRDYVYIPLGGNRDGKLRKYFNAVVVMLLSGLWHGTGINFIIWGAIHGLGIVFTDLITSATEALSNFIRIKPWTLPGKILNIIGCLATMFFVFIAWIFFAAPDFDRAKLFFATFFNPEETSVTYATLLIGIPIAAVFISNIFAGRLKLRIISFLNQQNIIVVVLLSALVTYVILKLCPSTVPPFIYFSF